MDKIHSWRWAGVLLLGGLCSLASQKRSSAQTTSQASPPRAAAKGSTFQRFQRANQLYQAQQYQKAARLLSKLRKQPNGDHFAVHYNLGNANFRLGRYGHALASYRRAQRLRPNDEALLHNLQLLYQRTGQGEPAQQSLQARLASGFRFFSLRQLYWLTLFGIVLACFLWGVYLVRQKQGKHGMRWWAAFATLLALLLLGSLAVKSYQEQLLTTGVITQEKITVRSGYGANFEALFTLQQAEEVVIRERTSGWTRIEITQVDPKTKRSTLRSGWVPNDAITTI